MGDSKIQWTNKTWNPITGCTKVSPGCDNCYAEAITKRFKLGPFEEVTMHLDRMGQPFAWKKPQMIFVCSMSDLFHPAIPFSFVKEIFEVMIANNRHTFQVLTKRPGRMAYFAEKILDGRWPDNVWAGTSVESQKYAPRLDVLAKVPANVRFVSCEPLLAPLDLSQWLQPSKSEPRNDRVGENISRLDSVRALQRDGSQHLEEYQNGGEPHGEPLFPQMANPTGAGGAQFLEVPEGNVQHPNWQESCICPSHSVDGCQSCGYPRRDGGQPYRRRQTQQRAIEPGVIDAHGKHPSQLPGVGASQQRTERDEEHFCEAHRSSSAGNPQPLGLTPNVPDGTGQEIQGITGDNLGNLPAQNLEASSLIHWVICGGESGPKARPMDREWVRKLRDDCLDAGVPYFFKQWGAWCPFHIELESGWEKSTDVNRWMYERAIGPGGNYIGRPRTESIEIMYGDSPLGTAMFKARLGAKDTGAMLDGEIWREFPASEGGIDGKTAG